MKSIETTLSTSVRNAEEVRKRTQELLGELEPVSLAQSQLPLRACFWASTLSGLILILIWTLSTQGLVTPPEGSYSSAVGMGAGITMLLVSAALSRLEHITVRSCRILALIAVGLYCLALAFNGILSASLLAVVIVYIHTLIKPRDALALGLMLLVVTTGWASLVAGPNLQQVSLRVIGEGLLVLTMMQLTTRQGSYLIESSLRVLTGLKQLSESQDLALRRALDQRDMASQTDAQTGLLNAHGLEAQLARHLADPDTSNQGAVVAFRLERFDECISVLTPYEQHLMLRSLLARLTEVFGSASQIAHLGNGKFIAFWTDKPEPERALERSELALARLRQPIQSGPHAALMMPYMGQILWPRHGLDPNVLLRGAQFALLVAREQHLEKPVIYEGSMESLVVERDGLVRAIHQAVSSDEFELHYQAIRSLQGSPIRKAEALIRWNHPERGRVAPAEFIPLAEATGQIVPITDWVLTQARQQLAAWRETIDPGFQISVNMPPAYIEYCSREPERALQRLRDLKVPHQGITLEITEGALLTVTPEILRVLTTLQGLGFQIALDDFGVGYSCFGQMDKLPLDFLKIDKSLVDEIDTSAKKLAICKSIISVAHELGFKVVAEGVETERQSALLKDMGCDFGQGYLYSRPLPAADLQSLAR
jgi:EAL domain-containing protein (putative c-di-GMP-specific phosphodiesterase class I)/GGDEF domain-containing protein